jgi:hypothetical protein
VTRGGWLTAFTLTRVMMAEPVRVEVDVKVSLGTAGWVALKIETADLAAVSVTDKRFLLDVIERLGRLAGRDVVPPALPAVLRGVVNR